MPRQQGVRVSEKKRSKPFHGEWEKKEGKTQKRHVHRREEEGVEEVNRTGPHSRIAGPTSTKKDNPTELSKKGGGKRCQVGRPKGKVSSLTGEKKRCQLKSLLSEISCNR